MRAEGSSPGETGGEEVIRPRGDRMDPDTSASGEGAHAAAHNDPDGDAGGRIAVVGGGIVGLATARALLRDGAEHVLVLEAEDRVARHQTGRNSGVIHSGLYYEPGSLKARTCAAGREAMYRYCARHDIPHRRCGKLVVAASREEVPRLQELQRRGEANGLDGLRRLSAREISDRAPGVSGVEGLWVPQTGITDFAAVARAMARDIEAVGGGVRTGARVVGVSSRAGGVRVTTPAGGIDADVLVNCAGLYSDRVARMCGVDPGLRIVPFRGDYFRVSAAPAALAEFPVYPVPDPRLPFLGVHFTPDLQGRVEAGPNATLAFSRTGYELSDVSPRDLIETLSYPGFWRVVGRHFGSVVTEMARSLSRGAFARAARRLAPGIRARDLRRSGSGVRAQAVEPDGNLVDDFRIVHGERSLHVVNAPSPGATASLAIGRHVAKVVRERAA